VDLLHFSYQYIQVNTYYGIQLQPFLICCIVHLMILDLICLLLIIEEINLSNIGKKFVNLCIFYLFCVINDNNEANLQHLRKKFLF
jgi:hypothetical protein